VELEQAREHGKLGLPSRNHWLGLLDLFLLLLLWKWNTSMGNPLP
jgi:hypothetical protein